MAEYNEFFSSFKKKAESMDREVLEKAFASLAAEGALKAEIEHEELLFKLENELLAGKIKNIADTNFPDTRFCQKVNPVPI